MSKLKISIHLCQTHLHVFGILLILLLAVLLLWRGNATSMQALPAMVAQVHFDGEYRIADGPWQEITVGEHIPATKGDVTLRGNFHMLTPDGEYIGLYTGDLPIAFYVNHIHLTFYTDGNEPFITDMENPLFGSSACGVDWTAHTFTSEEPIEIRIHNPHRFGNKTAIDALLANTVLWTGIDFEKSVLQSGEIQRDIGLLFMIIALALLGIALFSALIHIKNSKLFALFGLVILFAGTYFSYSADGISFWRESTVSNTIILGCAMILYMFFLSLVIVYFLESTKRAGIITVAFLGTINALLLILPLITDLLFYDTWVYWVAAQLIANLLLLFCLVKECFCTKCRRNCLYVGATFPLIAFGIDVIMTSFCIWKGGIASMCIFIILFAAAMVAVLKIIPHGINAATKAKALEAEKAALNAQLAETRISTMMSQIRPHFIYNTLGSIEQLCDLDPKKAGALVHNFAKYLRGNFGELDNPRPIPMSQEIAHVRYYISIEKVRFPDMTFLFDLNSGDFYLPALTIQPIVENAVKHGLMKRDKGGTIRVTSYETATHYVVSVEDDGIGFDTSVLQEDRAHMGIRNIRERLKAMVNGTIEIESTVGHGTKVLICIPKEGQK